MAVHDKVNAFLSVLNNGQRAMILEMIRLDMIAQLEEKGLEGALRTSRAVN